MLSPYTVLDLTDHRGELTAMMLGDMGADVIKIEPPLGSSSRQMSPYLEAAPEMEQSLHFFFTMAFRVFFFIMNEIKKYVVGY